MRALFLLLVAANLAYFAWMNYYAPQDRMADPRPLAQQIAPERLKIVPPEKLEPAPSPAPAACLEWGSFTLAAAPSAEKALEPLALGARLSSRRSEETARWWVFIPPQGGRAGAQRSVADLKARGADEYFILQEEGKMRWAVSLGIFGSEAAAKSRLESLRAKGVRNAQVGPRDTTVTKIAFRMQDVDPDTEAKLEEIAREFPGSELRPCP